MGVPSTQSMELEHGVDVASPCIGICKYAPNTEVCVGCHRTKQEITDWMFLSNSEKEQVMEKVSTRRGEYQEHGDFPSF
jgi:predicted Fe-S protein YdhL (DUF1289 family)